MADESLSDASEHFAIYYFEPGKGIRSSRDCSDRLKRHWPDYDKGIDDRKITLDMSENAIDRAKVRDNPPCVDWPRVFGSTVYKLVEKIFHFQ